MGFVGMSQAAIAQSFSLSGVDFSESAYLEAATLSEVAGDYTNKPISFSDLQQMVERINALYAASGVVTARAILPPQEIRNGRLRVELVEATVDQVSIEGLDRTDPEFLRRSIVIEQGTLPDFEALERELRLFEIAHGMRPTLAFAPGSQTGTTSAILRAEEPERYEITGSIDNFGSVATGELRGSLFGQMNSVTGALDTLSGQLQVTEGAASGSLGYSRPIGARGGRISASVVVANSNVIAGPFEAVDIVSDSASGTLGYAMPFWVGPQSHWGVELSYGYEDNTSSLDGLDFADVNLQELVVLASYQRLLPTYSVAARVGFKSGRAESSEVSETEGDYMMLFGSVSYAKEFSETAIISADMNFQLAPDENLPAARLFNAGGALSLRGYPNAVRSGDSGFIARVQVSPKREYDMPGYEPGLLSPFGFADFGMVVPFREDGSIDADQDYLASLGLGVRGEFSESASGVIMIAVPMIDTLGFDDSGSAVGYIGLDYNF